MIKLGKNIIKFWIVLFATCIFLVLPVVAKAATLHLLPSSQDVYKGDSFIVTAWVDTEGEKINAIEGYLSFSKEKFEVIDIGKGGSIFKLWLEEPFYSNQTGKISFAGGIPNGFEGRGQLISITFRVLSRVVPRTSASITFKENSRILLNDGKGTPAQLKLQGGKYEIIKKLKELPVITSETHSDQSEWYRETILHLHWDLVKGAEYSWVLSRDQTAEPDEIPDKPKPKKGVAFWMGAMEYDLKKEGDGIYYFSLRQKLPGKDWSREISRFKAMIDSTSPKEFEPKIGKDPAVFGGRYFLNFSAQDETSGIDHYEVSETPRITWKRIEKWKTAKSPYLLEDQTLKSIVKVKAVDKAGNERIAKIVPSYKTTWKDIVFALLILAGIIALWWIIRKFLNMRNIKPGI